MKAVDHERHFPWYIDSSDTDNIDCQCGAPCDGIAGWATHLLEMESSMAPSETPLQTFAEVWSSEHLAHDIGEKLRCEEVEALAQMLRLLGNKGAADQWVLAHSFGDECDDMHCRCDDCGGGAES